MEEMAFDIGDTVALLSGGPAMTVCEVHGDVTACMWFDGSELRKANFPSNTIECVILDEDLEEDEYEADVLE
jgi:uncharacterized protein YodC (DUF2158 family)